MRDKGMRRIVCGSRKRRKLVKERRREREKESLMCAIKKVYIKV